MKISEVPSVPGLPKPMWIKVIEHRGENKASVLVSTVERQACNLGTGWVHRRRRKSAVFSGFIIRVL